ncbi:MAG: hypothetical protein L6R35_003306 [Caloplaca aegaea]|nr:MAG: hypothetical protein L6R35_003306 [Caloplaca aegaea]
MGIQAYLTRLALGRSAYDPLERVPLPDQPEESQSQQHSHEQTSPQDERQRNESRNLCEQSVSRYIQDYDDKGHPQNLTSQELSRRSRRAQNEVLAIAGVIQRPDQRYQESTAYLVAASDVAELQGSFEETDNDAAAGLAIIMPNLLISTWFQGRIAATQEIAIRTLTYISLALPKPDNPDDLSVAVALLRNEDADVIGGLDFLMIQETDEIKKDAHTVRERAQTDWAYVRNRLSSFVSHCRSLIGQDPTPSVLTHGNQQVDTNQSQLTSHRHSGQDRQSIERRNDSTTSEDSPSGPLGSGTDDQGVHDRHSAYVHWTPEIRRNLEIYQHEVYDGTRPTHRVTHLTASMSTMMAVCLSTTFAHFVCLPLETLFLRSVALAYLDTTLGTPWASGLRKEIYPVASWFGMGLRGGRVGEYARKMTLCFGLEMVFGYGLWQLGAGLTWWIGTRRHRWGKL